MNHVIDTILPDIRYKNGFLIEGKNFPYYSFCKSTQNANWSSEMSIFLEESSRNHFIDRYNRKIALEGIQDKLSQNGCNYIDIGCSSGYMLEDVVNRFPNANTVGADYFSDGLIHCHNRLPSVPLFQMDIVNCKFQGNLFDAVTCLNVLEHIQADDEILKQIFRILKPTGILVITVPLGPHLYDMFDEIHFHIRRYTRKELKHKVQRAGFRILKMNSFGVFIYPTFYVCKKYNKFVYGKLTFEQKKKIAINQALTTGSLRFMRNICELEYAIGKKLKYPFGIRGYLVAQK
jgi:ubiquinone/menaquinone biosynthesis C-methylase UbiE